jgi:hypothetical protein
MANSVFYHNIIVLPAQVIGLLLSILIVIILYESFAW